MTANQTIVDQVEKMRETDADILARICMLTIAGEIAEHLKGNSTVSEMLTNIRACVFHTIMDSPRFR